MTAAKGKNDLEVGEKVVFRKSPTMTIFSYGLGGMREVQLGDIYLWLHCDEMRRATKRKKK